MTLRPAKIQLSLGIRPVWSESSLPAWRNLESLVTKWAHSEDSDQTGPRLMCVFARRTLIFWFCYVVAQIKTVRKFRETNNPAHDKFNNQVKTQISWASTQSDKRLCCPHAVATHPKSAQRRLIRLDGCPGWSESSLGAHSFCWFCHVVAQIKTVRQFRDTNEAAHTKFNNKRRLRSVGHPPSLIRVFDVRFSSFKRTKKTDHTGRMSRLIWAFAGRTAQVLVLSCSDSKDKRMNTVLMMDKRDMQTWNNVGVGDLNMAYSNCLTGIWDCELHLAT